MDQLQGRQVSRGVLSTLKGFDSDLENPSGDKQDDCGKKQHSEGGKVRLYRGRKVHKDTHASECSRAKKKVLALAFFNPFFLSLLNCINDVFVAGAATEVTGNLPFDIITGCYRITFDDWD